jgi:transposase InsO family protein
MRPASRVWLNFSVIQAQGVPPSYSCGWLREPRCPPPTTGHRRDGLENPRWGYDRIEGEIRKLGHRLSPTTVRNILKAHGIEPAPERRKSTTWRQFLSAHWYCLVAADFFTVEVCSWRGLVTYYVLFVMELSTRRVRVAGITRNPNTRWMMQIAKTLTDPFDGFLLGKRYLIIDRDTKYCDAFVHLLNGAGVKMVRLPAKSPNLNAYAERFVRTIKEECLGQLILFSERSLRHAVDQYIEHYHDERPHQGIGNQPIERAVIELPPAASAECRKRLGGLLCSYERRAA